MNEARAIDLQDTLQGFSPLTRKILALGLLFLGLFLLWTVTASPVISTIDASLTELNDARFQRMRLEQIQSRPALEPTEELPANLVTRAKTSEEAQNAMLAQINALAMQNGFELVIVPRPPTKGSKLIAYDVSISGDELNIIRFINSLERGNPMMRFRGWQIDSAALAGTIGPETPVGMEPDITPPMESTSNASGNILFSGQIVGAWTKP